MLLEQNPQSLHAARRPECCEAPLHKLFALALSTRLLLVPSHLAHRLPPATMMRPSAKPIRDPQIEQAAIIATLRDELREEAIWRHQQAHVELCLRNELKDVLNELTLATTTSLQCTGRDVAVRHRYHLLPNTRPLNPEELHNCLQETHKPHTYLKARREQIYRERRCPLQNILLQ